MKTHEQIAAGVDVTPLVLELQRQPELWDKNPCRLSQFGPHRETQDVFLRYRDERPHIDSGDWSCFSAEHIAMWYQSIDRLPAARQICSDLMARVKGEMLGGVFLYRVPAGKQIYPHRDPGWHPEFYDKFNVCLKSNAGTAFEYPDEGEAFVQQRGDVHWFRNDVRHQIINRGQDDHIVLTICIRLDRGDRVPWSPDGWTMDGSKGRD